MPSSSPQAMFMPDLDVVLTATTSAVSILPGQQTRVWTYQSRVLKGNSDSVQDLPGSYLGPIFRVRRGLKIRVRLINDLPDPDQQTIVHWHGLHLPSEMDAHPRYAIEPGQSYQYEFEVTERAGTYWFHPHPEPGVSVQVYTGLAGLFIVSDEEEQRLDLPAGAYDIPLVIQDRRFDADNQFVYLDNEGDRTMGMLGEQILVNGQANFALPVDTRPYRLRLLNGSNARIYKLAWSDRTPLIVIGTDGGLLEEPVNKDFIMLAPGERVELWADFGGRASGTEIMLESLAFSGAEGIGRVAMDRMLMDADAASDFLPLGAPFPVLTVRIDRQEDIAVAVPQRLSTIVRYRPEEAVNSSCPRAFGFTLRDGSWRINDRVFEMEGVNEDEIVTLDTIEIWELVNKTNLSEPMDPLGMAHPIHIHGAPFQVLERDVLPELRDVWERVRDGYVDQGWKDTVMLMPGERVKIILRFADYTGLFVFHCHNLEHEAAGMMRNYQVRD